MMTARGKLPAETRLTAHAAGLFLEVPLLSSRKRPSTIIIVVTARSSLTGTPLHFLLRTNSQHTNTNNKHTHASAPPLNA